MKINTSDELISYVSNNYQVLEKIASELNIEMFDLKINSLLYLPRILDQDLNINTFEAEVLRIGKIVQQRQQPFNDMHPPNGIELKDLSFEVLSASSAKVFHEMFHYLASYRPGAHYCLMNNHPIHESRAMSGNIVGMLTLSPYDLWHLNLEPESTMVLSRSFAFRGAPKNTFSYLFSKAFRHLRSLNRKINTVITYFNENLGFKGGSYNPSEWKLLAHAHQTRYEYSNGLYITKRYIKENNIKNIERSKISLKPQKVLIYGGNK